jgi:tetratricopeptide (TPR) repeat protein
VLVRSVPPPPPPPVDKHAEQAAKAVRELEQRQNENYEKAVESFNARKFSRALPLLEKAAEGPNATLRHRAQVYADICRRQISSEKVELKTADDHYNYGVKLMNDRRLEEAERHLQRALRLAPKAGYVHYANAVLSALQGNAESAFGNLKRAIEIDPLNRVLALNDADLGSVMGHPPIARLLHEGSDR